MAIIASRDRKGFARHAAPGAIEAYLRHARKAERAATAERLWLETLLAERRRQVDAGEWPALMVEEPR